MASDRTVFHVTPYVNSWKVKAEGAGPYEFEAVMDTKEDAEPGHRPQQGRQDRRRVHLRRRPHVVSRLTHSRWGLRLGLSRRGRASSRVRWRPRVGAIESRRSRCEDLRRTAPATADDAPP